MFSKEDRALVKSVLADPSQFVSIYHRKERKVNGRVKYRKIIAPSDDYKLLQQKIKYYMESMKFFDIAESSYAWIPKKSREQCAYMHIGQKYILEADISDFFGSIGSHHLEGLFTYNEKIPYLLNFLEIELDELINLLTFKDKKGNQFLAQGFATSPILANAVRYPIDIIMEQRADANDWIYTNYGDNLFISGSSVPKYVIGEIGTILEKYDFKLNTKKSKVKPYFQRQKVLGIVVNKKLNIPKLYVGKLMYDIINASEIDAKIMGKINQLRISENPRNFNYLTKLIERIHGKEK